MKRLLLAAITALAWGTVAWAQITPAMEVSVGYSAILFDENLGRTANGGSSSLALNLNHWLGVEGDFGLYHTSYIAPGLAAGTFTFGPRLTYRHWNHLTPFAHALLGGARSGVTALAFGAGGGADITLDSQGRFALRPQVEYFGFRANGNTTNTLSVGMGFVFRIGRRS